MKWISLLLFFIMVTVARSWSAVEAAVPVRVESALGWDNKGQSSLVMALARDAQNTIWAATEGGIYRYRPQVEVGPKWLAYRASEGLIVEDQAYALAVDTQQRVWAGLARGGVGVCNSDFWTAYGRLAGPLGEHVTAIAPDRNGDVWIGSDGGLCVYRARDHKWRFFTRAEGLPSDQISAIAFSPGGNVVVGTLCNGIAIGSRADDFKSWRAIEGPTVPPSSERGRGLPSALINALLTARDGRLYAGTNCGLAWSDDDGESWQWVRGRNWEQKSRQLFRDKANSASPPPLQVLAAGQKAPAQSGAGSFEVLREDYVSCLAQDGAGHLLIGHWRAGWEMRDPTGARALAFGDAPDYVRAFLSTSEGLLIASYGSGLLRAALPANLNSPAAATYSGPPLKMLPSGILFDLPKFPAPVRPPTAQQLKEVTREVVSLREPSPPGHAAYLGEDWETRGDWMGRYGRQHAVLCAAQSPTDHEIAWEANYPIEGMNGPHQNAGDGLRRWVDRERWDDERVLYDPFLGYRREAEWDDHGEAYAPEWEGPDVWFRLQVPRGTHRLSLYFFNKDGDGGLNRWRDYLIEIKGKAADVKAAHFAPALARCRVRDFRMGVYERFVLQGPSEFWVRVGKNSSFNTTLNGIFLDRIDDPQRSHEWGELPMTGNIGHSPPADVPPRELPAEPQLELYNASRDLWRALDTAIVARDSAAYQENARILAYRAFSTAGASMSQLARWRWAIPLWLGDDRGFHLQRMEETFKAQQKLQNLANNVP